MSASKSCGAPVFWCETENGKRIHNNLRRDTDGNVTIVGGNKGQKMPLAVVGQPGEGTHTSHFATCPQAADHRR